VGIVRHVAHGCHRAQDPKTFALGIIGTDLSRFSTIVNPGKAGGGGEELVTALAATLGEAVERYCMFFYDKRKMILAPYADVADVAVSPETIRLYSKEQIDGLGSKTKVKYFTDDVPVRWVWGYSLTTRRPVMVPAAFVYMNYEYDDHETAIGRNASTGLAANLTLEEAILTGLYEVVERDAFTICWLLRRPGRRVLVDGDVAELARRRFYADHPSVEITVHDVTLDIAIPSMFLMMKRPTEFGTVMCVGSASRLDPRQAVRKCLLEAGQSLPYFRFLLHQLKDWEPAADYSDVTSFDHHAVFYIKRHDLVPQAFAFLGYPSSEVALSAIDTRSHGRVLADINECVDLLKSAGLEVIVVDITTEDVLDVGMRVVRVLIPGMVPLHGVHKYPFLGAKRLRAFMKAAESDLMTENGITAFPHPFP
jgi:ribosomal protein S12 methylthiotransferase accessory factor